MNKLNKLFDLLFIVFISFIISSCLIIYLNTNKSSLFGYNIVNVLSGSMEESNIYKDDIIIIKNKNVLDLEIGDIICYNISNNVNYNLEVFNKENYTEDELNEINLISNVYQDSNTTIYLHQIVNIYIDNNHIYFETKGTSNPYSDTYLVDSNDVIGVYVDNSIILTNVYAFINTTYGKYILFITPSFIILLYSLYITFRLFNTFSYEKKLLNKEILLTDKNINKDIVYSMKNKDKYILLSYNEDKVYCAKLLWRNKYKKYLK